MAAILGIDYGRKRIGVAVSDAGAKIASPLTQIDAAERARAINAIAKIAAEYEAAEIVVGLPVSLNESLGPMAQEAAEFAAQLRTAVKIPVNTFDERFTTAEAARSLIDADLSRAKRKRKLDKVAAQIMLQSYLDSGKKS
jgi:putative Holliday junction resolvase